MKTYSQYITLFSAIVTLLLGIYSSNWPYSASAIAYILWAMSPYILLATVNNLMSSKAAKTSALIVTLTTCTFGLGTLIDASFIHVNTSDYAVFNFVALWQWAALLVLTLPLTLLNIMRKT